MEDVTTLERLVGNYGVPVAVMAYLLFERWKLMVKILETLTEIKTYFAREEKV